MDYRQADYHGLTEQPDEGNMPPGAVTDLQQIKRLQLREDIGESLVEQDMSRTRQRDFLCD